MSKRRNKRPAVPDDGRDTPPPKSAARSALGSLWEWTRSILVAILLAMLIRWPLVEPFKIPSGSMRPTFLEGDRIFVNKFHYGVRWPFNGFRVPFTLTTIWYTENRIFDRAPIQRWDIVVFKSVEPRAPKDTLVKRVVGLPGERIHIANGKVYVNGVPLELPEHMPDVYYTSEAWAGMDYGILEDDEHSLIPERHYFLLGDNSANSADGRRFGWVPEHHILGRVNSIWWPVTRWRDFTGFSRTWWWRGLVALLAAYLFTRLFLGRSWYVHDTSLSASVKPGEHVYVNRVVFGVPVPFTRLRLTRGRDARRGEIVLYRAPKPSGRGVIWLMGRVAGLPKERVFLDEGRLEVDGAKLTQPASLANREFTSPPDIGPYGRSKVREYGQVPDNAYFVLVDDPTAAPDSRGLGWVRREQIVGVAKFIWWPVPRVRRLREHE